MMPSRFCTHYFSKSGRPSSGHRTRTGHSLSQIPTRTKPEFEFSDKSRWLVSNPQLRLRLFDQISMSRTGGLDKRGRIRRVKERKERLEEREVNKVSCSLLVGTLWPVVRIRRRLGTKGSQLWLLGLVHWQASCPPEYPEWSGCQSHWIRVPAKVAICYKKGTPSRARNWALV